LLALSALAAACSPYDAQQGEFNAGSVDAANFALPYKGANGDPNTNGYVSGRGTFTEIRAYVNRQPRGYYSFPFTTGQTQAGRDPLLLYRDVSIVNLDSAGSRRPYAPNAYVFDPTPPSPFPQTQSCTPPPNYQYNEERDDMRLDEQSNILTLLPIATVVPGQASRYDYVPVVGEVAVSAAGRQCQSLKSERTLIDVLGSPAFTGNYLLWAIVDPSAGVYRVGELGSLTDRYLPDGTPNPRYSRGQSTQRWGWFGQYYLAYIDGGYIPTQPMTVQVTVGNRTVQVATARMATQSLYVPDRVLLDGVTCGSAGTACPAGQVCASDRCQTCTASGARACPSGFQCGTSAPVSNLCNAAAASGTGADVLEFARRDSPDRYTPVCEVRVYNAGRPPAQPPKALSELPKSAADVRALDPTVDTNPRFGSPRYFYCPQVD
jgi:hypothetical protein